MPIEIRELVIKATVNPGGSESSGSSSGGDYGVLECAVQESVELMSEIKRQEKER